MGGSKVESEQGGMVFPALRGTGIVSAENRVHWKYVGGGVYQLCNLNLNKQASVTLEEPQAFQEGEHPLTVTKEAPTAGACQG